MARVTVEDCVTKIPNRFELVLLAVQRARDLTGGAELTVERENDKNPVVALREIAEESVAVDDLRQALISGLQKHVEMDEPEDDGMEILAAAGKEWAGVTGEGETDAAADAKATTLVETEAAPAETDEVAAAEDDRPDTEEAGSDTPAEAESDEKISKSSEP